MFNINLLIIMAEFAVFLITNRQLAVVNRQLTQVSEYLFSCIFMILICFMLWKMFMKNKIFCEHNFVDFFLLWIHHLGPDKIVEMETWTCEKCMFTNQDTISVSNCEVCMTERPTGAYKSLIYIKRFVYLARKCPAFKFQTVLTWIVCRNCNDWYFIWVSMQHNSSNCWIEKKK